MTKHISGRDFAELALDKVADPNQLALTRKEEQYLRLAQEGRFEVIDPQFASDRYFLPYQDLWGRLNGETRQAILEGQKLWAEVAGYWGRVLNGQRPAGPQPVDWWGVRGVALEQVEERAHTELQALEQSLQRGEATPGEVGDLLQRLDVYRAALGDERFDRVIERSVTAETRQWLTFRTDFVEGKKTYWHQVITDGKEAADRWDAEHYQPLRTVRDGALADPTYGPLVQGTQAEAVALHEAYAALYQAKMGWWEARRAGGPTEAFEARGAEARERLRQLDPEAEGLWGVGAPWHLDGVQRAIWEQEQAAREAAERARQREARSAAELQMKFEILGWSAMVPHAELIWEMSQKHGLQAEIIAAKIMQESKGDPNANAGPMAGKGLMQIEFSAHRKNIPGATDEQKLKWIFDPRNNLEYGTRLLKDTLDQWIGKYGPDEGLKRGLQYWNYGPGAAAWVEARTTSPDDWQYWVNKYSDTHRYNKETHRWEEVESGGRYGTPYHWKMTYQWYEKLMQVKLSERERLYDGKTPAKGTTNLAVWLPVDPPLRNAPGERSASIYLDVVDQFAVQYNPRYVPRDTTGDKVRDTFCNIFVWDVTRAMGAEVPFVVNPDDGSPSREGKQQNANAMVHWLRDHGSSYGWHEVTAREAQEWANAGKPAVAAWDSGSGAPGHVAMVIPGEYDADQGPTIAQSGGKNYNRATVRMGFGKTRMGDVRYYVHE